MLAILLKYFLKDDLVSISIGDDGRSAIIEWFLIFREKSPLKLGY
jgi:hypothetical protein